MKNESQAGAVAVLHRNDAGQIYWTTSVPLPELPLGVYVPVEALEGLVEALRNEAATIAKPYGFVTERIIGRAEGLESCAERIERLIKERSNG